MMSDTQSKLRPPAAETIPRTGADGWPEFMSMGYIFYFATSLTVGAGLVFGASFVQLCDRHPSARAADFVDRCAAWDGEWYVKIVNDGYSYNPNRMSSVAFYPAYPWLSRVVGALVGLRAEAALLIVSHAFLVGAFVLFAAYLEATRGRATNGFGSYTLLAFGLFPTTLYFRMTYTESMLVFLAILAMYGMERGWHPGWTALAIGLATATRPVGVALLAPFGFDLWRRVKAGAANNSALAHMRGGWWAAPVMALACWGILAYMAYQNWKFDEPLAFVKTQQHWRRCKPPATWLEKSVGLVTFKPIREVYRPGGPCYWKRDPPADMPFFNGTFLHPIYFLFTAGMVAVGAVKGWLNSKEWLLSVALLGIPYVANGDCQCMASEMRYSSVVFPLYIVLGHLLARLPAAVSAMLLAASAVSLALYTALFTSWYWFY